MNDPLDSIKPDLSFSDDPSPKPDPSKDTGEKRERKKRSDAGVKRGPRGSRSKGASDNELEKALEEALVLPSIPMAIAYPTVEGKMFMINHFTSNAPWGAKQLVEASKYSPALRAQLEKMREKTAAAFLISFAAVYLGAPMMYIAGRHQMAEGVSAMAQLDESALQRMMESVASNMMMQGLGNDGEKDSAPTGGSSAESSAESQTDS